MNNKTILKNCSQGYKFLQGYTLPAETFGCFLTQAVFQQFCLRHNTTHEFLSEDWYISDFNHLIIISNEFSRNKRKSLHASGNQMPFPYKLFHISALFLPLHAKQCCEFSKQWSQYSYNIGGLMVTGKYQLRSNNFCARVCKYWMLVQIFFRINYRKYASFASPVSSFSSAVYKTFFQQETVCGFGTTFFYLVWQKNTAILPRQKVTMIKENSLDREYVNFLFASVKV